MKAYKAVNVSWDGTLTSAFIYGSAQITYRPGVWTPTRRYGPFVFDTLKNAREYFPNFATSSDQQIWECETSEDVHKLDVMVYGSDVEIASLRRVRELMDKVQDGEGLDEYADDPWRGTLMASSIKLTKKIEIERTE